MVIVIIGNSAAGINAAEEIRRHHSDDKIIMISKETEQPYSRVLLPYFLRGKLPNESQLFIRENDFYKKNDIEFINGLVTSINEKEKWIKLQDETLLKYDKLLITSGSSPVTPPIKGLEGENILHMWTWQDAKMLEKLFHKGKKVLILGSGFVSLQAAWAAIVKELDVYVYELMSRIMPRVIDDYSAEILTERIKQFGVKLEVGAMTERIERLENGQLRVIANGLDAIDVDFIIVGTGVRPNTQFLAHTNVDHQRGIKVDEFMQTNIPDIYAAGDVASGPTTFEENMIHALWPTAVEEGKIAGSNMIGVKKAYEGSLNMNVTQMFNTTVASIGKFEADETKETWFYDLGDMGIFKLVLNGEIPMGAAVLGSSELVEFLGILRPLIRNKKAISCDRDHLFQYLRTQCDLV
jgi:nitrite reductase (NADH) large subunit